MGQRGHHALGHLGVEQGQHSGQPGEGQAEHLDGEQDGRGRQEGQEGGQASQPGGRMAVSERDVAEVKSAFGIDQDRFAKRYLESAKEIFL